KKLGREGKRGTSITFPFFLSEKKSGERSFSLISEEKSTLVQKSLISMWSHNFKLYECSKSFYYTASNREGTIAEFINKKENE
ncbi:MAG: hypothetical protein QGG87_03435, partial [Nitrospinota bacterium]|nr:hypothetical protein [Nitrospinota bacterium]